MYLKLPPADQPPLGQTVVSLPGGTTQLWPTAQPLQNVGDPLVYGTVFQDPALWHPAVIERVCEQASLQSRPAINLGGRKVRDAETWAMPGMQLLMQRALLMFCKAHRVESAFVYDRWVNVMNAGEYSDPHCHYDAQSAVVYSLDIGDSSSENLFDGSFELKDPRIAACCPVQPGRPAQSLAPLFRPGMMLLFPAEFLHYVHLYSGKRPRITVAWNISAGEPPKGIVIDPTKQVSMRITNQVTE